MSSISEAAIRERFGINHVCIHAIVHLDMCCLSDMVIAQNNCQQSPSLCCVGIFYLICIISADLPSWVWDLWVDERHIEPERERVIETKESEREAVLFCKTLDYGAVCVSSISKVLLQAGTGKSPIEPRFSWEKNYRNLLFSPLFVLSRKNYLVASHRLLLMPRIAHSLCCSAFSYFRPSPIPSQADVVFVKYFTSARFTIMLFHLRKTHRSWHKGSQRVRKVQFF